MADIIRKKKSEKTKEVERIEGNGIFLNGQGDFPKTVNIWFPEGMKEYTILKSRKDTFQMSKPS